MIKKVEYLGEDVFDSILVIGNGYDLECGLKSSFVDFLKIM